LQLIAEDAKTGVAASTLQLFNEPPHHR